MKSEFGSIYEPEIFDEVESNKIFTEIKNKILPSSSLPLDKNYIDLVEVDIKEGKYKNSLNSEQISLLQTYIALAKAIDEYQKSRKNTN